MIILTKQTIDDDGDLGVHNEETTFQKSVLKLYPDRPSQVSDA